MYLADNVECHTFKTEAVQNIAFKQLRSCWKIVMKISATRGIADVHHLISIMPAKTDSCMATVAIFYYVRLA